MATVEDLRRLALALQGTSEIRHLGLVAFEVDDVYVLMGATGETADFRFSPDEQEFKCFTAPDVFTPAPGDAGKAGWTTARLPNLSLAELQHALEVAWEHVVPTPDSERTSERAQRESG